MYQFRISFALALLGLLACDGDKSQSAPTKPDIGASALSPEDCAARADAMTKRAAEAGEFRHVTDVLKPRMPSSTTAAPLTGFAPMLKFVDGSIKFNNESMANIDDDLRERMKQEAILLEMNRENLPDPNMVTPVHLSIAPNTPVVTLLKLVAVVPPSYPPRLLVYGEGDTEVYQPPPSAPERVRAFWKSLEQGSSLDQAALTSKQLTQAIGLCAPLVKMFGDAASLAVADKSEHFLRVNPIALRECQCGMTMDIDMYEALLMVLVDGHMRRQRWLPLNFQTDAKVEIALAKTATVADFVAAYDKLDADPRKGPVNVRLR